MEVVPASGIMALNTRRGFNGGVSSFRNNAGGAWYGEGEEEGGDMGGGREEGCRYEEGVVGHGLNGA